MKKQDSSDINAYILDEDTHYKVNKSHFTLGERNIRDMHQRHQERLKKVQDLAKQLGVEYEPCLPSAAEVINHTELVQKYYQNKELYDSVLGEVLSVCTPEEVLKFIDEQLNSPK